MKEFKYESTNEIQGKGCQRNFTNFITLLIIRLMLSDKLIVGDENSKVEYRTVVTVCLRHTLSSLL